MPGSLWRSCRYHSLYTIPSINLSIVEQRPTNAAVEKKQKYKYEFIKYMVSVAERERESNHNITITITVSFHIRSHRVDAHCPVCSVHFWFSPMANWLHSLAVHPAFFCETQIVSLLCMRMHIMLVWYLFVTIWNECGVRPERCVVLTHKYHRDRVPAPGWAVIWQKCTRSQEPRVQATIKQMTDKRQTEQLKRKSEHRWPNTALSLHCRIARQSYSIKLNNIP